MKQFNKTDILNHIKSSEKIIIESNNKKEAVLRKSKDTEKRAK